MLAARLVPIERDRESSSLGYGRIGNAAHHAQHGASSGDAFHRIAYAASTHFGKPWAFTAALFLVVGWLAVGPLFDFDEGWQLLINTGTTILTFLMVFLIQATQNRDAKALHLKLDELIRTSTARNVFADLEEASEEELDALQHEFAELRAQRRRDGVS